MAVATVWKFWDAHNQIVSRFLPGLLIGSRTDVRIDGLLAGCLAALILADPSWKEKTARYLSVPTGALCLAAYVAWQVALRHHYCYYTPWESKLLAVAVTSTVVDSGGLAARCLELRVFRWIGRLSYSLYLWQQFFLVPEARTPFVVLQRFPLNLVVLFGIAGVSYRFIERPMIRLGHKLAPPPAPGRDDTAESGEGNTAETPKPATVAA
jgi:peptidoglycan/LPS O-acetylase OafA/YrhL